MHQICQRGVRAALQSGLLAVAVGLAAHDASSQQVFGPGQERPDLEAFPEEKPAEPLELPPVPTPPEPSRLSERLAVSVREFAFEGGTVFSAGELSRTTAPYTGRNITTEELVAAAAAVTALYTEHGYVTSGAVVPDQAVEDGVVRIRLVEGTLVAVEVRGTRWFRPRYFSDRLMRAGRAPLSAPRLERALSILQRNRYVARVQARLEPGERLGESVLLLAIEERRPYDLRAEVSNDRSPAIGSVGGRFVPSIANLLGHADELRAVFDVSEGLFEWDASYELPLNRYDTRLRLYGRGTEADVVEAPFAALGIHSESSTYGAALSQPLLRTDLHDLWFRIVAERRELESCVEVLPPTCEPFSFLPGQPDPKQVVSALRFLQDWTWASATDVVAARMTWSVGLGALGATTSSTDGGPGGEFFVWLGQTQWAHRFSGRLLHSELVARADLQLANDPLLTLEKFAIGGLRTVRGYRENEVVRDNGFVGSIELRIPVLRSQLGLSRVQFVPFADVGRGWDERTDFPDRTLASLGVGLRIMPWPWLQGELYWGGRLVDVPNPGEYDVQDDGIHFRLTLAALDFLPWTRE